MNILHHKLHNQTQISTNSVLAQPFATLMNAITVDWIIQMEDLEWSENKQWVKTSQMMRQEDVNKLIKHELDQAKFPSMLEPILWNSVFCQSKIPIYYKWCLTPVNFS